MAPITDREELKARLRRKSEEAARKADAILSRELQDLRDASSTDLEALRPKVSDAAAYAELIRIVNDATAHNENLAQLSDRVRKAGGAVRAMAHEIVGLLGRT